MFGDPKVLLAQLVRDIQDNLDFTNSSSQGARPRVVIHETPILERFVFHQTVVSGQKAKLESRKINIIGNFGINIT